MTLPSTFVAGFHDEPSVRKMEYQPLGETGLVISKISMGGGVFSPIYGKPDDNESVQAIRMALRAGINYIDTAPWYGQGKSEELLGIALNGVPRKAYYIGTKVGRYELNPSEMFDFSPEKTRNSVEKSLKLLQLDYVDVIQIHDIEFAPSVEYVITNTLPILEEIVRDGKARHIGVTGYPLDVLAKAIASAPGRFETCLTYCRYSLIDHTLKEYLDFFKNQKIGIICASGHAMGLLTNAGPQNWHPAHAETKELCSQAAAICKERNVELGKLAMYHFVQLCGPTTFLVGMQSCHLIEMNLNVYLNGLTEAEANTLNYLQEKIFTTQSAHHWEGVELAVREKQLKSTV